MSVRPVSMFRDEDSIARALVAGDFEDLTIPQIAEVLLTDPETIRTTIHYVKNRSGYIVPYKKRPKRNVMAKDSRMEVGRWKMSSRRG